MSDPQTVRWLFIGTATSPFLWARAFEAKPIEIDAPEDRDVWHEYGIEDAYRA